MYRSYEDARAPLTRQSSRRAAVATWENTRGGGAVRGTCLQAWTMPLMYAHVYTASGAKLSFKENEDIYIYLIFVWWLSPPS